MFHPRPTLRALWSVLLILISGPACAEDLSLTPNPGFEIDTDSDGWPDGWARVRPGGAWLEEQGNHFLRLSSTEPGKLVMLYQEIRLPDEVEAIELTWRQRVTGLKLGKQSWFDARIMMEFLDANREKVTPSPAAPATRKDTDGWVEKQTRFLVPERAVWLKFMPSLFQVEAGTFDVDDIVMHPVDPEPIRREQEEAARKRAAELAARARTRREKAAATLEANGSLIPNGNFEEDGKPAEIPRHWGRLKDGAQWVTEDGNRFLRLTAQKPDEMLLVYRTYDLPEDVRALELRWKQRVSDLKVGSSPWFDARIMIEFQGIDGKKLASKPSAPYTQKNTEGWVERTRQFLVPDDALAVVVMPSLFRVQQGTFDLDDLALVPTDPAPLLAAAEKRAAQEKARYVPPEDPDRAAWPPMLQVVANRLHDPQGNEVWLQGVNTGGLETLPFDKQVIKSVVVAIDDWNANCVRVPIKDNFWYGDSPYQQDDGAGYREIIDQIITLAANRGAYVVIDLHRFRAPTQQHADFWKDFAALYANHPAVLFDLFNEPHGISWEVWKQGGFVGTAGQRDESAFLSEQEKKENQGFDSVGMQALVDAVRSTGAKNVVIAGGLFWCNDLSGITRGYALDDPHGNGVMYSWHTYNWHTGWADRVLETAAAHPVLVGELGADINKMDFIPAQDQEDPYTWVPDMLGFIQKHRLNWTGWNLHPKSSPRMITDWDYEPTPFWGEFARQALSGKQFELKRLR